MILAKGEKSDVMYNENWDNWVLDKKRHEFYIFDFVMKHFLSKLNIVYFVDEIWCLAWLFFMLLIIKIKAKFNKSKI